MAKPLVVVESPAKAKTISKFLGDTFDVRASVGHVADLPSKGLAVDVDNGFKPTYELTDRGKQVVKELRAAFKDASELYLATDEDREGEAISWHLVEHLKPKVPVKRMVFHEITASAIDHAVNNPRGIDYGLVDAAETRRILDRLYGYEVSPVLWRRVNRGLSAGRVQSPSIRLIVQRERERIAFVAAGYWDLELTTATDPSFTATLVAVDGTRVATGRDFDSSGRAERPGGRDRRGSGPCARRRAGRLRLPSPLRRREAVSVAPPGSVHDEHAAAGGRSQAAPVLVAGDAIGARVCTSGATSRTCAPTTSSCRQRHSAPCGPRSPPSTGPRSCHRSRSSTRRRSRTPRRPTRRSARRRRCGRRSRWAAS